METEGKLAQTESNLSDTQAALSLCTASLEEANHNLESVTNTLRDTESILEDTRLALKNTENELSETVKQLEKTNLELTGTREKLADTEKELSDTNQALLSLKSSFDAYIVKRGESNKPESEIGSAITEIPVTADGKAHLNFTNTSDRPVRVSVVTESGTEVLSQVISRGKYLNEVAVKNLPNGEKCWLKMEYLDGNGRVLYSLLTPVEVQEN